MNPFQRRRRPSKWAHAGIICELIGVVLEGGPHKPADNLLAWVAGQVLASKYVAQPLLAEELAAAGAGFDGTVGVEQRPVARFEIDLEDVADHGGGRPMPSGKPG